MASDESATKARLELNGGQMVGVAHVSRDHVVDGFLNGWSECKTLATLLVSCCILSVRQR